MDQKSLDTAYIKMSRIWGDLSRCSRKKVGCLIVKDNQILSDGFNGTPSGMDNACENEAGETQWYVIHAEANAICKLAAKGGNASGATAYLTLSPCRECSKLMLQAGIRRVVYQTPHSDYSGVELLSAHGVEVEQVELQ
jgi:dCMP deaminase